MIPKSFLKLHPVQKILMFKMKVIMMSMQA